MSLRVGRRAKRRGKLLGLAATSLIVCSMALGGLAAPVAADWNQCAPAGVDSARALPKNLSETPASPQEDRDTTSSVIPLSAVDLGGLSLDTPGGPAAPHPVGRPA